MVAEHLPSDRYEPIMLDTLALMAWNPHIAPALREAARLLVTGPGPSQRVDVSAHVELLDVPAAFRADVQSALAAVQPATTALSISSPDRPLDVCFIALHGPWGEDGSVQGMLDLIGIPYVGSGTLASALAMDKPMAKRVLASSGVAVPEGIAIDRSDYREEPLLQRARCAGFIPGVVKPARQGSSVGMAMVSTPDALGPALEDAFRYDSCALVEERLRGTELSVGVLGNRELRALPVIEIVSKREFFDYQAKYDAALTDEICPARIPEQLAEEAQRLALLSHRALGCRGLSRTDFIHDAQRGLVALELNTMPGMTQGSLLPKAARVAGLEFPELLDRLVQLALEQSP
jgi:D-alanine-D-alanine ligase